MPGGAVPPLAGKGRCASPPQRDEFRLHVMPGRARYLRKNGVHRNTAQNRTGEPQLGSQFFGGQFIAAGIAMVLDCQGNFIRPGA